MLWVAVDAMGGDFAPRLVVDGALAAARHFDLGVALVGRRDAIDAELQRHGDILAHIQRWIKRIELEHHGNVALFRRQIIHAPSGNHNIAFRCPFETSDHAQRGGLAASGRTKQADHLTRLHRQVSIPDSGKLAIFLGDFPDFDCRHVSALPFQR